MGRTELGFDLAARRAVPKRAAPDQPGDYRGLSVWPSRRGLPGRVATRQEEKERGSGQRDFLKAAHRDGSHGPDDDHEQGSAPGTAFFGDETAASQQRFFK